MSDAPKRIWAFLNGPFVGMFVSGGVTDGGRLYLRADLAEAALAAEREKTAALVAARDKAWNDAIEAAAAVLDRHEGVPLKAPATWSPSDIEHYECGQLDASMSWQEAIRALARITGET